MAAWSKKLSTQHAITPRGAQLVPAPLEFDSAATRLWIIPNPWTWNKLAAAQIYAREPGIHAREESVPRHGAAAENQFSSRTSPPTKNKAARLLARAFCSSNRRRTIALSRLQWMKTVAHCSSNRRLRTHYLFFMDENCSIVFEQSARRHGIVSSSWMRSSVVCTVRPIGAARSHCLLVFLDDNCRNGKPQESIHPSIIE